MNQTDIRAIRDNFPDTPLGRLMSLIVLVATKCGLRESEIIALRWTEVEWETRWIRVIAGYVRGERKLPKGKKDRITPLPKDVKAALYEHFKTSKWNQPTDLVFAHPVDGSEMNASSMNEMFKDAVVKAGIRPVEMRPYKQRNGGYKDKPYVALRFHDTRHAWCSWARANGMSTRELMEYGGWEDEKTLKIYDHFAPSGRAVDLLDAAVDREEGAFPKLSPT